eukprot:5918273-Amphidinium_carterae.1
MYVAHRLAEWCKRCPLRGHLARNREPFQPTATKPTPNKSSIGTHESSFKWHSYTKTQNEQVNSELDKEADKTVSENGNPQIG